MIIDDKEYTSLAVVDLTGKLLISITDSNIIEHNDYKVIFGTEEYPIEYFEREDSRCYAREKGMDYGESRY